MLNKIEEVQRQYMYAVQPVKLFETQNNQAAQQSMFDLTNKINQSNHNPFHPDITNTGKGGRLDILG